jgi:hypothetical protein
VLWLWSISLYGSSVGEPGGRGSFAGDLVGYERKALETGISLNGGSVGQPGVGSPIRDFERWCGVSLNGSSVKGTWREGSLAGDPGGQEEKALESGIYFHRGPAGEPGRGSSTGDFERWMKGALGMELFSLKRLTAAGLEGGLLY